MAQATSAYLFLRSEIVDDVEQLADLLRSLALDHVGNGLATDVPIVIISLDVEYE